MYLAADLNEPPSRLKFSLYNRYTYSNKQIILKFTNQQTKSERKNESHWQMSLLFLTIHLPINVTNNRPVVTIEQASSDLKIATISI